MNRLTSRYIKFCSFVLIICLGVAFNILIFSRSRVSTNRWMFPMQPLHNESRNVRPLSSCINEDMVLAETRFAVVSMSSGSFHLYGISAMKLAVTVRRFTNIDLIMMTIETRPLSRCDRIQLEKTGWKICIVPAVMGPPNVSKRNRFLDALIYSKFNAWKLVEYEGVLLLDSDTLVVGDISSSFLDILPRMKALNKSVGAARDRPADISCRFGTSWNFFNAGVLLLVPRVETFHMLHGSIQRVVHNVDSAEQDLLNKIYHGKDIANDEFFELPFAYNAIVVSKVCEPDIWLKFENEIKIVHFTTAKGWMYSKHWDTFVDPFQCWWWDVQDLCLLWDVISVDHFSGNNACPGYS